MNNTKTSIVAVLVAATLVVGLTFATVAAANSASAYVKKPGHDDKKDKARDGGNENGNTVTVLKAQNKGFASGFDSAVNQEADNVICTHPGSNATCVSESEGAAAGGGGGGGGGGAACTVGVSATVISTGAAVCVTLALPIVTPIGGVCTPSSLVAVHIDGIDVCATVVV